ncbi:MAG: PaaI family thioesterase [Epsilonproteobacteria bacterium]|nr:PaaI family thioesterase [Campylobacterota bacterium]
MSEESAQENSYEDFAIEDDKNLVSLKTHAKIKKYLTGDIEILKENYAKVRLTCTNEMSVDEMGLVHGGFTFGAADFAAMAAVNEPYVVLIGSKSKFLAPVKVGDVVIFEAHARFEDARKREVDVVGVLNDIKVFEGTFTAVILEEHVLKLKLKRSKKVKKS